MKYFKSGDREFIGYTTDELLNFNTYKDNLRRVKNRPHITVKNDRLVIRPKKKDTQFWLILTALMCVPIAYALAMFLIGK